MTNIEKLDYAIKCLTEAKGISISIEKSDNPNVANYMLSKFYEKEKHANDACMAAFYEILCEVNTKYENVRS